MLVKNAKIVSSEGITEANFIVDEETGRIRKIVKTISGNSGEETIDLQGKFVLPGMVDAHVHMRDFREVMKEDFFTGTSAALAGGVTSIIDMPNNSLPTTSFEALEAKKMVAEKKALCDYAFYFGATNGNAEFDEGMQKDSVVAGMKIYMSASSGLLVDDFPALYSHFSKWKKTISVHAEAEEAIRHFSKEVTSKTKNANATHHSKIRDSFCAELAVSKAIALAEKTKAKLHVCHISTEREIELISEARKDKITVTCEVSPHHLFLDESFAKSLGNYAKTNPPLRSRREVSALWDALQKGKIEIIASDHAPHLKEEKEKGYENAPSGVPGLETTLPLLLNATNEKRLDVENVVKLYSENPAEIFGLRRKGGISVGKDADFVVVDMKKSKKVRNEKLFTKCGWSPFNGMTLKGKVERTFLRGKEAFDGESVIARLGNGKPIASTS